MYRSSLICWNIGKTGFRGRSGLSGFGPAAQPSGDDGVDESVAELRARDLAAG